MPLPDAEHAAPDAPGPAVAQSEPAAPASVPEGTELAAPAPATPQGDDADAAPAPDALPGLPDTQLQGGEQPEPAPSEEPAALQTGELPLWTGDASEEAAAAETEVVLDLLTEFRPVQEACMELVPPEQGMGADLFADLESELRTLPEQLADAVSRAPAEAESTQETATAPAPAPRPQQAPAPAEESGEQTQAGAQRDAQQEAAAVNTALRQADAHAEVLQNLPEWQRVQTVRGAFGNLVRVLRERAGEHADRLMGDGRVSEFFRRVSLRACEKIAGWAQAGADRLRRDDERNPEHRGDRRSAEALLRLGDAASAYSAPRRIGGGSLPPSSGNGAPVALNIPEMRELGAALERPLPTGRVSSAAARGRSTTAVRGVPRRPAGGTEQAGHLRREGADQQQGRRPNQR